MAAVPCNVTIACLIGKWQLGVSQLRIFLYLSSLKIKGENQFLFGIINLFTTSLNQKTCLKQNESRTELSS